MMKCPYCGGYQTMCVDSRTEKAETFRRRRYLCKGCLSKFLTYEFVAKSAKEARERMKDYDT